MEGTGEADARLGQVSLHLNTAPGIPTGFDPALSQRICNFALSGYTATGSVETSLRDAVDRKLFVRPTRVGRIFDAAGEEIVRLEALTTMAVEGGIITVTNWMSGFSRLPCLVVESWGDETLSRIHTDDSREETPDHMVANVVSQLGLYAYLDMPAFGGALVVYGRQSRADDGQHRRGYGLDTQAVSGDPFVGVTLAAGDLILFQAENLHRVEACSGPGRRIILVAFLGQTSDGSIVCWS